MSGFTWRWPIALLIGAVLAAALVLFIMSRTSRKHLHPDVLVQEKKDDTEGTTPRNPLVWDLHSYISSDPGIRAAYRSYRALSLTGIVIVCIALLASLGLLARPSSVEEDTTSHSSRDIILCLDVSGSALPFDREVIATYLDLVKNFKTERIGMSIFNSTSRTVFPLTDDYSLVTAQLKAAMTSLKGVESQDNIDNMSDKEYQAIADWLAGTQNRKDATSLIGDGLVNCATMMPDFSASADGKVKRDSPASIVFASDNVLSGSPLYSLQEALSLAQKNDIRVDALYTGEATSQSDATTADMRKRVEAMGGSFFTRTQTSSVEQLIRSIETEKSKKAEQDATTDLSDSPAPWIAVLLVLLALYFVVMGWLKR